MKAYVLLRNEMGVPALGRIGVLAANGSFLSSSLTTSMPLETMHGVVIL